MSTLRGTDFLTFGTARWRFINPAMNQFPPKPEPDSLDQWEHIPYGGNVLEGDGSAGPTKWTPAGGIYVPTAADYNAFLGLSRQFAPLVTPWGTFVAYLADASGLVPYGHATITNARGTVRWEWA